MKSQVKNKTGMGEGNHQMHHDGKTSTATMIVENMKEKKKEVDRQGE